MKQVFVPTSNYRQFQDIGLELLSPSSSIGPSLAMVTGRAGRGKTESARFFAVNTDDAIYIRTLPVMTPTMLLSEIVFEIQGIRPRTTRQCLSILEAEGATRCRLIILDEADLLPMKLLETMRGLNERTGFPIMLIGEDELIHKVASRRRILSRIRRRMEFGPITQQDISVFYREAMGLILPGEIAAMLHKATGGDWRPMVKIAADIERAMRASGAQELTMELAKKILATHKSEWRKGK